MFAKILTTATPNKDSSISSIEDGKWAFLADNSLVNTHTKTRYVPPSNATLMDLTFVDVPDLNPNEVVDGVSKSFPLTGLYLFTLKHHPLPKISDTILSKPNGLKIRITKGNFIGDPNQVSWVFPEGGIGHTMYSGAYKYVPMATDYIVNDEGVVRRISTGKEVTAGSETVKRIDITLDNGKVMENVEIARLVLMAFGKYTIENIDGPIYFLDNDHENIALSNISFERIEVKDKTVLNAEAVKSIIA